MTEDATEKCNRTLISQSWLGILLVVYFSSTLAMSIFSPSLLIQHSVSMRKIAMGDLTKKEFLKSSTLTFAFTCGFFLFANFGARTDFGGVKELSITIAVGVLGVASLLVLTGAEFFLIWRGLGLDRVSRNSTRLRSFSKIPQLPAEPPVLEIIWGFSLTGIVGTLSVLVLAVCYCLTNDDTYSVISMCIFPICALLYIVAFLSKPRRTDGPYMLFFFANFGSFVASEIPLLILQWRLGNRKVLFTTGLRVVVWSLLLKYGIKFRAQVAALSDDALSRFLLENVLKNATATITPILFVTFKTLNCVMENASFEACQNSALCSSFISVYVVSIMLIRTTVGAMKKENRLRSTINWERLAVLDLVWREVRRSEERRTAGAKRQQKHYTAYITNNLQLVASLLAFPIIPIHFAIRFVHRRCASSSSPRSHCSVGCSSLRASRTNHPLRLPSTS